MRRFVLYYNGDAVPTGTNPKVYSEEEALSRINEVVDQRGGRADHYAVYELVPRQIKEVVKREIV